MSWHRGLLGDGERIAWPRVLFVSLVLTVGLALGVVATTSSAGFGPYNPAWDGSSELRAGAETDPAVEAHHVGETAEYEELPPEETVAFVVAPDEPYKGEDAERLRAFVADGGTLVVFENFDEAGNALLAEVGADARVDGQLLRDEQHHFRGPAMPVATEVADHRLTTGVEQLTLNYGTAVDPGGDDGNWTGANASDVEAGTDTDAAAVLVATSDFAYLGPEEDDLDQQDDLRSYPVATVEAVDDGRVVVVGDPSVTVNAMLAEPDNEAFVRGLYGDADHVVFDHSHADELPPLMTGILAVRGSPVLQLLVGTFGVGLVAGLSRGRMRSISGALRARLPVARRSRPRPQRDAHDTSGDVGALGFDADDDDRTAGGPGLSDAERAEFLRRRHPDWDDARIRRVITALNTTSMQGDDDK
ncbi:DUF4350 domain-containing protein [Natrialbaceae archaeon GCM10025810]|uniref:DUF4350 domain-containing protein n=1 Tax=Halovalidus salilacus TaxID=3075124 RepID=UPI00361C678C